MKILITGANGFIGRRLCKRLITSGHEVVHPSRTEIDISKPFSLSTVFDVGIHLAAYNITHVGAQDQELYTAINVEGTRNLLQAATFKRFIYLSTSKVYKTEGKPLTEESPLQPQCTYEQSKLKAEELCRSLLPQEALVILRSVNVLGEGQAIKAVVPVFFQKARAHQALDIMNAALRMPFVYVEDLIDAFEAVISHPKAYGVFNIAYPDAVLIEQLARKIIDLTHSKSILNIARNEADKLFSPVICDKAFQQLGWRAKTDLSKILEIYAQN